MALGDGAWTPYPRTLIPGLFPGPLPLDPGPFFPHAAQRTVQHRAFGTGPPPSHRQVSLFKDVCSKTLAIVAGSSHF